MAAVTYADDSAYSAHSFGRGVLSEIRSNSELDFIDSKASSKAIAGSIPGVSQVHTCLGEGSYSHVWECSLVDTKERVAVKVWKRGQKLQENRECTLLQELSHPNLVRLYRVIEGPPSAMIMELCSTDLRQFLHSAPYVEARANLGLLPRLRAALDVVRCVTFLHENGVMHRDIKPGNCFITEPIDPSATTLPLVRLGDLGLARRVDGAHMSMGCGTLRYMAPEIAELEEEDSYSFPADIYSCGMLVYELCTGIVPFSEDERMKNEVALVLAIAMGQRPSLDSVREDLKIIIDGCWDQEPEERITIQELQDFLINIIEEEEATS
mmetsp:Transcript_75444/g.196221  ORF Transcript_75444/g.196221 Transcript_75444/m.196221 type:complete len:324 (+) Transcript_75444:61-1032(+)